MKVGLGRWAPLALGTPGASSSTALKPGGQNGLFRPWMLGTEIPITHLENNLEISSDAYKVVIIFNLIIPYLNIYLKAKECRK